MKPNRHEILDILAKILTVNINTLSQLGDNEDINSYGLTSISAIQMMVVLEEKFEIEFNGEDLILENINTINKIQKMLRKYIIF